MTALAFTAVAVLLLAGVLLYAITHPRQETTVARQPFEDPQLPSRWTHEGLATPSDEHVDLTMDKGGCTIEGRHEHHWHRGVGSNSRDVHVCVSPTGVVVMSEGALEQLLVGAGFERAEQ